jgi:hypothetical protein
MEEELNRQLNRSPYSGRELPSDLAHESSRHGITLGDGSPPEAKVRLRAEIADGQAAAAPLPHHPPPKSFLATCQERCWPDRHINQNRQE